MRKSRSKHLALNLSFSVGLLTMGHDHGWYIYVSFPRAKTVKPLIFPFFLRGGSRISKGWGGGGVAGRPLEPNPNPNPKWRQTAKRGVTTTRYERELIFFLYLFSISNKVTFRFFLLKNGGWISTLSTPLYPPLLVCLLRQFSVHSVTHEVYLSYLYKNTQRLYICIRKTYVLINVLIFQARGTLL